MTGTLTERSRTARAVDHALGFVGELAITVGVLLLLFVVYQLWWTTVLSGRAADQQAAELRQSWTQPAPGGESSPSGDQPAPDVGSALALAWIPRLRDKVWGMPVMQGVDLDSLARGLGHYPDSALPGEVGNFAVAGHRATHGEPLRNVDRLQAGDQVIIETRDSWFVYTLDHDQIVAPDASWVVEPVPGDPGATPTERLITVTTCNPRWASTQRWIWWGTLTERVDKATGTPPAALRSA